MARGDDAAGVKTTGDARIDALYKGRKGKVEFVEVPELGFVAIDGRGAPGGETFTAALQALYTVSYGAHFAVKKAIGQAPRVMALEALWWMEGWDPIESAKLMAAGGAAMDEGRADQWRWQMMIMQLPPIGESRISEAIEQARAKKDLSALGDVRYERWAEGPSAQIMHVGPYSEEGATIATLHAAIAAHGAQPRGKHHEIYLGDPRTAAPDKLRTILRQPIEARKLSGG